jgi:hypothetical protein
MRRVREILRLEHECGVTDGEIARSATVVRSTVALTLDRVCGGSRLAISGGAGPPPARGDADAGHRRQQGGRCKAEPYCIDGLVPSAGHTSRDAMRQDVEDGSIRWRGRLGSGQLPQCQSRVATRSYRP